ncbi:uncharacterized protein LOC132563228 [Ylistrum balloti]|uniref:uncharacterized protein LOC132563228 n=1 Tax=Ylistrum balloti TaxID=509963 RepID=UPI002905A508|nr:uncharacterized protein LOC132563228 [Ylistrum balloti]
MHTTPIHAEMRGKVLLFGEHLIFHGASALGLPLPNVLKAVVCVDGKQLRFKKRDVVLRKFLEHISVVCRTEHLKVPTASIELTSSIPKQSGFGSSAALSTALASCILQYNGHAQYCTQYTIDSSTKNVAEEHATLWRLATLFEDFFHSPSSGIDTALSMQESALVLERVRDTNTQGRFPSFHCYQSHIHLAVVAASYPRSTQVAALIARAQSALQRVEYISKLIADSNRAIALLTKQDIQEKHTEEFSILVESIHTTLRDIGLSSDVLEHALQCAIRAGAIAAKMSGAGGGGALVCFCGNSKQALVVADALRDTKDVREVIVSLCT